LEIPTRLSKKRLILFSGLGLDARYVTPSFPLPFELYVPPWIDPLPNESLESYALRIVPTLPIDHATEYYIGGVSFGGMVALEVSRHLNPRGVFLISSCPSYRQVSWLVRLPGKLIAPYVTPDFVKHFLWLAPLAIRLTGPLHREQRNLLIDIWNHANLKVMRWGAMIMTQWEFTHRLAAPVHHLHARYDLFIPLSNVEPEAIVADGWHAFNLTHPREMFNFIAQRMSPSV
jgi:pimeloyl-ACP methyl ester carboxylesterase